MISHGGPVASLRLERLDATRLSWALAASIALHLLGWGGYALGQRFHVWERLHLPAWVSKLVPALFATPAVKPSEPVPESETPLMFVNVNPDTATPEPPEKAKFYSNLNSKASNPNPDQDTDVPKFTGTQEVMPETVTVERNKYDRLQPTPPTPPVEQPQPEGRPKPAPKSDPGDLVMAKPELKPRTDPGKAERERPRRLSQVQQPGSRLPSQMMKQDGGVSFESDVPSLDTKSTMTGMYDWLFIQSVKARWFDLLENRDYSSARGYVRLQFRLQYDGRITDMKVLENTVTETLSLICQKAVLDPAPFEKWTKEMRLLIGKDFREITFTFYYY